MECEKKDEEDEKKKEFGVYGEMEGLNWRGFLGLGKKRMV